MVNYVMLIAFSYQLINKLYPNEGLTSECTREVYSYI